MRATYFLVGRFYSVARHLAAEMIMQLWLDFSIAVSCCFFSFSSVFSFFFLNYLSECTVRFYKESENKSEKTATEYVGEQFETRPVG